MLKNSIFVLLVLLISCNNKKGKIHPELEPISESIYASGTIKSKNQYEAFVTVSGNINNVFIEEGDTVKKGQSILSISNDAQRLGKENAALVAGFSDFNNNREKLNEAGLSISLSRNKLKNDSSLYFRQKALWQLQIGTKVALEQSELAYQNSKTNYYAAIVNYNELKRQLNFTSSQSKKNLSISSKLESDYTLKSEIDGIVYRLNKVKGEIVNPQTALAIIGDAKKFVLEMQVDEYDIIKVKKGLPVLVSMDTYKGKVFEAIVSKVFPIMNEKSKTFLIEAEFTNQPETLYPNISFEANIVLQSKPKTLVVPRNYLINDSIAVKSNGDKVNVKTGLKDYQKIEIISGLTIGDELKKPSE